MPELPATIRGVFLSYAREDTDAARRIADALRGFGVEVWFDQSELRGGDQWDAKIKKQIRECALFLPLVSGQTQERSEGYFRREWKLAVDRTHDMAAGRAFVVPVVIDGTLESEAEVPEEFMKFQWTRLANGEPTPEFVAMVKGLLEKPRKPALKPPEHAKPPTLPPMLKQAALARKAAANFPPPAKKSAVPGWVWAVTVAVLLVAAVGVVLLRKPEPPVAPPPAPVTETKPAPPETPKTGEKSIAVLPFANMSADKDNAFFADGVHDEVITALARIHALKVISRTSVMAYRDPAGRNLKRIAAELGVTTVLEGSVQRAGSKVHLNAQLIDARTDEHLWADTFDGDTSDIFALQAKLAQQIATALKATLTPGEKTLIERRPTENQEAYDLYLRARAMVQERGEKGSVSEYERIIAVFEQAVAKDPSFALAHTQIALIHSILYWFGYLDPSSARAAKMKAAVDAAVRLAPDQPETRLALGAYQYRVNRDWAQALVEFRRAEAGLPNDAQLRFWLAITHRRLGRWTEALDYFRQSVSLNPRDYAPVQNYTQYLVGMRHWQEAADETTRFLNYFPSDHDLLIYQAAARFDLDGDRAAFAAALGSLPRSPTDPTGAGDGFQAAVVRGDYAAADKILAESKLSILADQSSSVINDSVSFLRARLAIDRGDAAAARQFATDAIAYYRSAPRNPRQEVWMRMRIASAEAWSGQEADALRDGSAALADGLAQDRYDATVLRGELGEIYALLGRREEAIATLRLMMNEPSSYSPNNVRHDPIWSRLKDDPRFEEILRSAKPL